MLRRHVRPLIAIAGVCCLVFISCCQVRLAAHKPFWLDEGEELVVSCSASKGDLFMNGAPGQCSPPPLYYVLLKGLFSTLDVPSPDLLVKARLISLLSALGCLALVTFSLASSVGAIAAALALVSLNNQPIIHLYAAENRPYMFWMLLFAALLFVTARLASQPLSKATRGQKTAFVVLSVALSLTVGPGMLQVLAAAVTLALCWTKTSLRSRARFLLPPLLLTFAIGLFYARHACRYDQADQFDLLKTHDWNLLWSVVWLLFPRPPTGVAFSLLAALGLALPAILWKHRRRRPTLFALACACAAQTAMALPIGVLVALKHYYFVQRVFLYLAFCRAIAAACGAAFIVQWFSSQRLVKSVLGLAAATLLAFSLLRLPETLRPHEAPLPGAAAFERLACERVTGPLTLCAAGAVPSPEVVANLFAGVGARMGACHESSDQAWSLILDSKDLVTPVPFHFAPTRRAACTPLRLCGI